MPPQVDDKAAKSLLGESFKRQLKMDGGFNSVTFICSKTDDISLEEAQDSLGLEDEMSPDWAEVDRLNKKRKTLKKHLEELKALKLSHDEAMNDADEQIDTWVCKSLNHVPRALAWSSTVHVL